MTDLFEKAEDDLDGLDGETPTRKRRKLANKRALSLSLNSGCYPEYLGLEGPCSITDPSETEALDYLELLWPPSLCDVIVDETNRYAKGKLSKWVDVSRDELYTFFGIVLIMGVHRLPRIDCYWSTHRLLGIAEVKERMTMSRFWELWVNLHVVDNSKFTGSEGISRKIRPVLDVLGRTFPANYSPAQELSIDEAMVKYKGHCKGKVRMPKKPIKLGYKIWCLCCSCCGYLCSFQLYEGKPTDPCTGKQVSETGMVKRVVTDLVSLYEGQNHVVYCDNFFTSGPLVDALAEVKVYLAGTIQQRASGFPELLKGIKPAKGCYVAHTVDNNVYYVFNDRKMVSFVSNVFPEAMPGKVLRVPAEGRLLKFQSVPPLLPAYNKFMGAVDRLSQVRKTYGYDRKSRRYWLRLFYQFFDYAVNNAYLIYVHNCRRCSVSAVELMLFRLDLANLMVNRSCTRRLRVRNCASVQSESVCHLVKVEEVGLARGRCSQCLEVKRKPVRFTSFACSTCCVRLCRTTCFAEYHKY